MRTHCKRITRGKPETAQSALSLKLDFGFDLIVFATEFFAGLMGYATMRGDSTNGGTTT